jgi:hypothetical protein
MYQDWARQFPAPDLEVEMTERAPGCPNESDGETLGRVHQIKVPAAAEGLSTLCRVDYADAFHVEIGVAQERTAEQWARALLEGAPDVMQKSLRRGWSGLGLRLGPLRSDRFVLGWEVRRNLPESLVLGADSLLGLHGELLFWRQQEVLLFATFLQIDNHVARAVWAGVTPLHLRVVRKVLEQAGSVQ